MFPDKLFNSIKQFVLTFYIPLCEWNNVTGKISLNEYKYETKTL